MSAIIEATEISFRIGGRALVDGVSVVARAGETVALVGPNGAGKSTLLRLLSGELTGGGGAVRLKGQAIGRYRSRDLAQHRAVLSQHVQVAFPFSVREIVRMGAGERRGPAVDALVDEAMADVDLGAFGDRIINTLSGGEQQRAHFARVLVQADIGRATHGPGALLLDEPTASLDLRHQIDIAAAVKRRAAQGCAVVLVLHDLNYAGLLADRLVVLAGGRVAFDGPPAGVIGEAMLEQVFGVRGAVHDAAGHSTPVVLPHGARKREQGDEAGPLPAGALAMLR